MREELAAREQQVAALGKELAERDERIAALERRLANRAGEIATLERSLGERDGDIEAAMVAAAEQDARIVALEAEIARLYRSNSWLLTRPLRAGRRLLTRSKHRVGAALPLRHFADGALAPKRTVDAALASVRRNGGVLGALARARYMYRREGWRGLRRAVAGVVTRGLRTEDPASLKARTSYPEWVARYDTLNDDIRARIRAHMATLRWKPLISVVLPVYDPAPACLEHAIQSVLTQLYPHWELCIADDASSDPEIRRIIARYVAQDARVKAVYRDSNGHICHASNAALELAEGEFVAFLDHDDVIAEHALYWVAAELNRDPDADVLYSDSDMLDDAGQRCSPYFKPDFNVELMLGHNMVGHLGVYRRSLVTELGGMRPGFEGSQDYDLLLRALVQSSAERIRHVPAVLYHWRRSEKAPSYSARELDRCAELARRAIREFLAKQGVAADVMPAPARRNWQRVRYHLPQPAPKVSIIIPTRNKAKLLERCVKSLLKRTNYRPFDITIVDNGSDEPEALNLLANFGKDSRIRIVNYPGRFNFSAINNFAVGQTDGDMLAFLNNDVQIIHPDWMREMVSHAARPGIGAVGAKLYYPNGDVQHAGVLVGMGGVAGHLHAGSPRGAHGMYGETILTREVSAVTAACMVMRRSVFLEVGGFNELNLPVAFNDVDLCLRVRERGYKNLFTPFAELIHHESATRGSDYTPERHARFISECEYIKSRWPEILPCDPCFNPNRSLDSEVPGFATPPRLRYPWETAEPASECRAESDGCNALADAKS